MWGESDLPQFNALFGVSALILMNIITLVTAFEVFTGQRLSLNRAGVIGGGLALIAIGYFLLVYGGKYQKIAKEFGRETQSQRNWRLIACVFYVALTFVSFFWLVEIRNS